MTYPDIPELDELATSTPATAAAADVEASTQEEPEVQPPARPWLWRDLNSQQELELWTELGDFVDYLAHRYAAAQMTYRLSHCWYRHPIAVEELTALMVAHTYAYGVQEPTTLLVEFHERSLWPTLRRVHELLNSCLSEKKHVEPGRFDEPWSQHLPEFEQHILAEYDRAQTAEQNAQVSA